MTAIRAAATFALTVVLAACAGSPRAPLEALRDLAPTGKLRVGLYTGNPLVLVVDPASGQRKGVAFELGAALAGRLGVPFEPVVYPTVGALMDARHAGAWDVTFIVHSAAREKELDFAPAHAEAELGYLVPRESRIATIADVDRAGVRIAVPAKGQGDAILTRQIREAMLVRTEGLPGAVEAVRTGKADVFAAIKPSLFEMSAKLPGARVLEGRFAAERVALAMPKGRPAGLAYARDFIASAKADGSVAAAIGRSGARGVAVAGSER